MRYKKYKDGVELIDCDSFDIKQILECGQCFRFWGEKNNYFIIAHKKILNIRQYNNKIFFWPCNLDEFENIWINYFDLETNYLNIKKILSQKDNILAQAIKFGEGIRILNQEKFECLISFIISQNNRIPQIKKVIENISRAYGTRINNINNNIFAFPDYEQLKFATQEKLINCKTGFRAKYILDAIKKNLDLESLKNLDTQAIKKNLIKISGVGNKVADCVLLFSFGRHEVFPTDTWIKKISQEIFFSGQNINIKQIHEFAKNKFGDLAGYAQQYLFYYFRSKSNISQNLKA